MRGREVSLKRASKGFFTCVRRASKAVYYMCVGAHMQECAGSDTCSVIHTETTKTKQRLIVHK